MPNDATSQNKIAIVTGGSHGTHADPDDRPAAVFGGKNRLHFEAGKEPYLLLPIIP
jgi:uncharacterized protein